MTMALNFLFKESSGISYVSGWISRFGNGGRGVIILQRILYNICPSTVLCLRSHINYGRRFICFLLHVSFLFFLSSPYVEWVNQSVLSPHCKFHSLPT